MKMLLLASRIEMFENGLLNLIVSFPNILNLSTLAYRFRGSWNFITPSPKSLRSSKKVLFSTFVMLKGSDKLKLVRFLSKILPIEVESKSDDVSGKIPSRIWDSIFKMKIEKNRLKYSRSYIFYFNLKLHLE